MGDLWGCLALAEECAPSDEVLFLLSGGGEAGPILRGRGVPFHLAGSLAEEEKILRAFQADAVVVNKLNSPPEYIRFLKGFGGLVATLEDTGEGSSLADLRLNVLYHRADALTDPRYIALRKEFRDLHPQPKIVSKEVKEILVTQGGSDTRGFTPKILRALEKAACPARATVVLGPAFRHERELQEAASALRRPLALLRDPDEMAPLMRRADLAVTAGGITLFELACLGVPSIVVCGERFETETADRMAKAGAAVHLGFGGELKEERLSEAVEALAADPEQRKRLSARGKEQVDGQGAARVVQLIRKRLSMSGRRQ